VKGKKRKNQPPDAGPLPRADAPAGRRSPLLLLLIGLLAGLAVLAWLLLRGQDTGAPALHAAGGGKAQMAAGWHAGPALDIDGFHLAVLETDKANFGVGERVMAGQFDCAEPGYWGQQVKLADEAGNDLGSKLRYFKVAGDAIADGPETDLPAGYRDVPLTGWTDGRTLSMTFFNFKELADATQPRQFSYTLVQPTSEGLQELQHYSFTGPPPVGSFPIMFPGELQLLARPNQPPAGPFPVLVWVCPPAQPGHALAPVSAVATGNAWRGTQRINVVVDDAGAVLEPTDDGTALEPAAQWAQVGALIAQSSGQLRQVALAGNFAVFDTGQGLTLAGLDGSRHAIALSTGQPALVDDPGGRGQVPTVDCSGPNCRIRALDEQTVVVKDDNYNRLTLIRRGK
jgi:hypothetical protein